MLSRLEFQLQRKSPDFRYSPHLGSIMHGVMMDFIEKDYGDFLHAQSLKPYSQNITLDNSTGNMVWRICALNGSARENILKPLSEKIGDTVFIRHKQTAFHVVSRNLDDGISYLNFSKKCYLNEPLTRKTVVDFITPSTFKQNDRYAIFPEIRNVFQSLYNKWNAFYSDVSLESEEALSHIIDYSHMIGYKLQSTRMDLEGVRIGSFTGQMVIHSAGPEDLARLARMLLKFGQYSGIGAKCSLGMGGIKCE